LNNLCGTKWLSSNINKHMIAVSTEICNLLYTIKYRSNVYACTIKIDTETEWKILKWVNKLIVRFFYYLFSLKWFHCDRVEREYALIKYSLFRDENFSSDLNPWIYMHMKIHLKIRIFQHNKSVRISRTYSLMCWNIFIIY
jgi:hypothetical protein